MLPIPSPKIQLPPGLVTDVAYLGHPRLGLAQDKPVASWFCSRAKSRTSCVIFIEKSLAGYIHMQRQPHHPRRSGDVLAEPVGQFLLAELAAGE